MSSTCKVAGIETLVSRSSDGCETMPVGPRSSPLNFVTLRVERPIVADGRASSLLALRGMSQQQPAPALAASVADEEVQVPSLPGPHPKVWESPRTV